MPKWSPLPSEPLKYHPYQSAFWDSILQRYCPKCETVFQMPPDLACPTCQTLGHRKFNRFALISGRRGGKTRAGAIAVAQQLTIPNSIWWACAPTNPKLMRYIVPAFQQLIPPEWVESWSAEYLDLRLKNGSLLHFQTLEDPDQGRGQGLDGVWIDEASELTADHWHVLRPSLTERRGVAIITTSPRGFDWVYEEFYKRAEEQTPGYWACKYATSENPIISAEELADAKSTMPEAMFRQEFLADFVIFTGAVYGGLVDARLLKDTDDIRTVIPEWPDIHPWRQVLVGIDTGADHPFAAVKLVTSERGLVVVDEYLERDRSYIQHAGFLKQLAGHPNAKWAINKNERQGIMELATHGIFCQKAENDVIAGTEHVKSLLHQGKLWIIESKAPRLVKQMKSYRYDDTKKSDGSIGNQRVYKKDDDLPDALRYICMTVWSEILNPTPKPNTKRDLSHLDPEIRASIERMRRMDGKDKEPIKNLDGEFWI